MGFLDVFKKPDPKELVRKWQGQLRKEMRQVDRQILEIKREEKKVEKSIKDCGKRNDIASARILAKELVRSRQTVTRLHTNKAQMNSVTMHLSENLAVIKAVGHMEKSAELMGLMNKLMKASAVEKSMRELSKEMYKAGVMQEMVDDVMEDLGDENLEEETEAQVDQILAELAVEGAVQMPTAVKPVDIAAGPSAEAEAGEEEDELAGLQARLDAIRA